MPIQYEVSRYKELSQDKKEGLEASAKREFGHVPIVKNHSWAVPDWCILALEDKRKIASVSLIARNGTFDDKPLLILGKTRL